MSTSESQEPTLSSEGSETKSKKASKKEAAKLEKQRRREVAAATSATSTLSVEDDPLAVNYGIVPLIELQSKTPANVNDWTRVEALNDSLENKQVLIRGRAQAIRPVGKKMAFLVIRENGFTVQCLVQAQPDLVSPQMVKFAAALSRESIVDVEGVVSIPAAPIKGATQQIEIQVRKLYCVSKAIPTLPINIEDAARSEVEIEKAIQAGEQLVRVNQDTRLNFRVLDLRTPANQGIFRIQSQVGNVFRQFLLAESFVEIHTPKLIADLVRVELLSLGWTTKGNLHAWLSHLNFTSKCQYVVILAVFLRLVLCLEQKIPLLIGTCASLQVLMLKWRLRNIILRLWM